MFNNRCNLGFSFFWSLKKKKMASPHLPSVPLLWKSWDYCSFLIKTQLLLMNSTRPCQHTRPYLQTNGGVGEFKKKKKRGSWFPTLAFYIHATAKTEGDERADKTVNEPYRKNPKGIVISLLVHDSTGLIVSTSWIWSPIKCSAFIFKYIGKWDGGPVGSLIRCVVRGFIKLCCALLLPFSYTSTARLWYDHTSITTAHSKKNIEGWSLMAKKVLLFVSFVLC